MKIRFPKRKNRIKEHDQVLPVGENLSFAAREAYNKIRTNIELSFFDNESGLIIGVTSATERDGKSFSAMNIAYSLAYNYHKVLLIGGDTRKPSLHKYVDSEQKKGLSDVLSNEIKLEDALQRIYHKEEQCLDVLLAGSIPPNPSELLGSKAMKNLLKELRQEYDYIIIDLPPVCVVTDALVLANSLDGMIVVARHGYTKKKNIREAMRNIKQANIKVIGFVYNANVERSRIYRRGYYYSYYYE